jgi:catechol 2,3-dioxygenase-like lactoylglutathione lyase family enzyme
VLVVVTVVSPESWCWMTSGSPARRPGRQGSASRIVGTLCEGGRVDQRISFVTLAVRDLDASRAFYVDGLGWTASMDVPGEVLMIQVGEHVVLSLWVAAVFEAEVGPITRGAGVAPITLAHNVSTREEVEAVLATARAAGADPVHDAVARDWGGYTGYFGDPDGYRWEIAFNPGPIGQVVLP